MSHHRRHRYKYITCARGARPEVQLKKRKIMKTRWYQRYLMFYKASLPALLCRVLVPLVRKVPVCFVLFFVLPFVSSVGFAADPCRKELVPACQNICLASGMLAPRMYLLPLQGRQQCPHCNTVIKNIDEQIADTQLSIFRRVGMLDRDSGPDTTPFPGPASPILRMLMNFNCWQTSHPSPTYYCFVLCGRLALRVLILRRQPQQQGFYFLYVGSLSVVIWIIECHVRYISSLRWNERRFVLKFECCQPRIVECIWCHDELWRSSWMFDVAPHWGSANTFDNFERRQPGPALEIKEHVGGFVFLGDCSNPK